MTAKTKRLIVENTFVTNIPHGWGNGYVAVPPEHPLYGVVYHNIKFPNIIVHGGVTFTEPMMVGCRTFGSNMAVEEEYIGKRQPLFNTAELLDGEVQDDWWLIGFDTCHHDDNANNWPKERVIDEVTELQKKLEKMFNLKKK